MAEEISKVKSHDTGKSVSFVNAYHIMENTCGRIKGCIENYYKDVQAEISRHHNNVKALNTGFANKKTALDNQLSKATSAANESRALATSQIQVLTEKKHSAMSAFQTAIQGLKQNGKGKKYSSLYATVKKRAEISSSEFDSVRARLLEQETDLHSDRMNAAQNASQTQLSKSSQEYAESIKNENLQFQNNLASIYERYTGIVAGMNPAYIRELFDILQASAPRNTNYEVAKSIPDAIEIGYLFVYLDQWNDTVREVENDAGEGIKIGNLIQVISDAFSFAVTKYRGRVCIELPLGSAFEDDNFNKLVLYDSNYRNNALEYLRALEMRMFMSIPCGKLHVTMIDPVDIGSNFSMFARLGVDNPKIISNQIWSDPKRIKEQLNQLITQISHVNQDCLRDEFKNIVEYNKFVGKNAEPLEALFVADYPEHFDQDSCELLEKIISSGQRCGVYTFIASSLEKAKENNLVSKIPANVQRIRISDNQIEYTLGRDRQQAIPVQLPHKAEQPSIFEALTNGIRTAEKITVNYNEVTDNLPNQPEKWFHYSTNNGLDIPFGLEGGKRSVQIHLGGESTLHHALISGTIGSGKSKLLHAIIMSILLKYSPEDVHIYLLDFKRGVEFKVYADSGLPNFKVIALDTEAEFGLAVLKQLDAESEDRGKWLRSTGLAGIEAYNNLADSDPNDDIERMPRIVLIIDEFQEMFSDPDSAIAKDCKRYLANIVRQDRAWGIHVVMASQVLPEGLESDVYSQMMNRVALHLTGDSARKILDSNNDAIESLISFDPGKCIFNNAGGTRDSNHECRIGLLTREEIVTGLNNIKLRQKTVFDDINFEKPRLLLSTIQDNNDNPLNRFVKYGEFPQKRELGCPLYLGEEIAMVDEFSICLRPRKGQNMLILGNDTRRAELLCGFTAISILFDEAQKTHDKMISTKEPIITYFDFSARKNSAKNNTLSIMDELCGRFKEAIRVFGRDSLMDGLETLTKEYLTPHDHKHYVIFSGLNRAKRLLESNSTYEQSPKETFFNLVKQGPEKGFNYIIWANEPSSFCSFYADLIPEFDYRLVYDLKEEEYEQVVMSSYLDTKYSNNVISFNPDDENKKVRIYSMPLTSWIKGFMDRLDGKIRGEIETFDFEGEFADDLG